MNLGQYIAQQLLEAEDQATIALFPGAFKPPHKGHFAAVKKLLEQADQVVVLISPKTREGVTADESVAIWELYKTLLDGSVEIRVTGESPVKEAYKVAESNPDTNFILASGKGEEDRFKTAITKLPNVKSVDVGNFEGTNATDLRVALQANNEDAIKQFIPQDIDLADFLMALSKKLKVNTDATPVNVNLQERQYQNTNDAYEAIVASEESEIERTAQVFNVPLPDMRYAFIAGNMVVLSDDIWSKLENSDSYEVNSLDDAIKLAKKYGKNWKPTLDAIKNDDAVVSPPLVLNYDKDKYYLVGGNTRLMFTKALGKIPKVLMGTLDLGIPKHTTTLSEVKKLNESETGTIGEFIKYAIKNLGIQNPPRNLSLSYDTAKAKEMRSFGYFDPNSNKIWIYCGNRNMGDILRTLAHELVHRKQDEDGRISYESGKTGSEIENEANAKAGVLLRDFGKQHEEIYQ
jgi:cytidyltransferase-like protein